MCHAPLPLVNPTACARVAGSTRILSVHSASEQWMLAHTGTVPHAWHSNTGLAGTQHPYGE